MMGKHYSPDRSLFQNHATIPPRDESPEGRDRKFTAEKKNSLALLLVGVIAAAIWMLAAIISNSMADPYSIVPSGPESFWSWASGLAGIVSILSLLAALITRIVAGIRR